ncbi:MAG TPA: cobalamin-dependent protein [Spirochaetia bacterium]|nr:cobalamin-dependent protein [Spirochaetia bacterium]
MNNDLVDSLANLDEDKALTLVRQAVDSGVSALEIVEQCRLGVEIVGRRYSDGAYFLSDLIMSEEILRCIMEIVEPLIPNNGTGNGKKIVMGTIEGDIHDLGKSIVISLLRSNGFKVYDLGVDVAPEVFLRKVRETGARMVGVCVLITYCINSIKKVVSLLKEDNLKDNVSVVIGGYPVNQRVLEYTGADYFGCDAIEAVKIFTKLSGMNAGSNGN